MSDSTETKDAIVIERMFDAPVDLIWSMWTEPEHFKKWYGPEGSTVPVAEMDVRVGGRRLVCMEIETPDGPLKMWTAGAYREVIPNRRLVYTESMSDEQGNVVEQASQGMGDGQQPPTTTVTVVLEDLGGRTRMVMTHAGLPEGQEGAGEGWKQAFGKLATYVANVTGEK